MHVMMKGLLFIDSFLQEFNQSIFMNGWLYPVIQMSSSIFGNNLPLAVMLFSLQNTIRQL
jgi:hypothetical protein